MELKKPINKEKTFPISNICQLSWCNKKDYNFIQGNFLKNLRKWNFLSKCVYWFLNTWIYSGVLVKEPVLLVLPCRD